MKNNRTKRVVADCLKRHRLAIGVYILCAVSYITVFGIYGILTEPLIYALVLTGVFTAVLLAIAVARSIRAARLRSEAIGTLAIDPVLPVPETLADEDHLAMIEALRRQLAQSETACTALRRDTEDILTAWVHQIKTPIATMRMVLSDTPDSALAREELFRIEQYADMMLQFVRLGSDTNDLVIREYAADEIIRESIRRFAPQFIRRKLPVRYEGTDLKIVTDRKWFGCILDQFLSNAVKYTYEGSVSITVEGTSIRVSDTGIGIAPEDLPRIFEKGYTGINGRLEKHSSGLGLFLAKGAAEKLGITLRAESKLGEGTCFVLDMAHKNRNAVSEPFPI